MTMAVLGHEGLLARSPMEPTRHPGVKFTTSQGVSRSKETTGKRRRKSQLRLPNSNTPGKRSWKIFLALPELGCVHFFCCLPSGLAQPRRRDSTGVSEREPDTRLPAPTSPCPRHAQSCYFSPLGTCLSIPAREPLSSPGPLAGPRSSASMQPAAFPEVWAPTRFLASIPNEL